MVLPHILYDFYDHLLTLIVDCYHESWNYDPINDQKRCLDLCGFSLETPGPKCCYNNATNECIKIQVGKTS